MIAPAPRKPMRLTIWAAIRVGSARTTLPPLTRKSWKPYADTSVKSAEPTHTTRCVRRPASRSRSSRSSPTAPPRPAAIEMRSSSCCQFRVGMTASRKCNRHRLRLQVADLRDAALCKRQQLVERFTRERVALRSGLHLDETAVTGHDDVHVGIGVRVFRIVEIQQRHTVDDAYRHGGHGIDDGLGEPEAVERAPSCDACAADRRPPRPALGLKHVADEPHRALAERAEVGYAAHCAPDQTLDLDRAPLLLAAGRLTVDAIPGRGGEQ